MSAPRQYATRDRAIAAWLRRAKRTGAIEVRGGGWWRVGRDRRAIQGFGPLGDWLARRGELRCVPARDTAHGLWAWELAPERLPMLVPAPPAGGGTRD